MISQYIITRLTLINFFYLEKIIPVSVVFCIGVHLVLLPNIKNFSSLTDIFKINQMSNKLAIQQMCELIPIKNI